MKLLLDRPKHKSIQNNSSTLIQQVFYLLLLFSSFLLAYTISDYRNIKMGISISWVITEIIWCTTVILGFLILTPYLKEREPIKRLLFHIHSNVELFILLLVVAFPRLFMLNTLQRGDAAEYHTGIINACTNFSLSWESFIQNFTIAGHANYGFSMVAAIGEFLSPSNPSGILSVNLIITLIAVYFVYRMMMEYWLRLSKRQAALLTLILFSIPLILGTFGAINPDYFMGIFFLYFIYFEYRRKYILMTFWAIMMTQTKETALAVIFAYLGTRILIAFFCMNGSLKSRIIHILTYPTLWVGFITGSCYCLYYFLIGGNAWIDRTIQNVSSYYSLSYTGYNVHGFAVEITYIYRKLLHFFITNFTWLLCIVLLSSLLVAIIKKRKLEETNIRHFIALIVALCAYVIGSSLYVTVILYRYNAIFVLAFCVVVSILYWEIVGKYVKGIYNTIFGIIILILFTVQSYVCIDPISNLVFQAVDTGSFPLVQTGFQDYYGDSVIVNRQYTWIDTALDRMLSECDYNRDTQVINAGTHQFGVHIAGNNSRIYSYVWDINKQKRLLSVGDRFADNRDYIPFQMLNTNEMFSFLPNANTQKFFEDTLLPRAIVYFIPYYRENEEVVLRNLSEYYYIGTKHQIHEIGGVLTYYELIKKDYFYGFSVEDTRNRTNLPIEELKQKIKNIQSPEYTKELYHQLTLNQIEAFPINEERSLIEYGDYVACTYEATIRRNGKKLDYHYFGTYGEMPERMVTTSIKVGSGGYLFGLEEALVGKEINEQVSFSWKVPPEYGILSEYAGETIDFTLVPVYLLGTFQKRVLTSDEEANVQQEISSLQKKNIQQIENQILLLEVEENITSTKIANYSKLLEESQAYYNDYFQSANVTRKQFCEEYIKMTEKAFQDKVALMILAIEHGERNH